MSEINDTHRSEDHVQRHSDVKVQGVVIDHADGKEHGHHDHIVTVKRKRIRSHEILIGRRENNTDSRLRHKKRLT